ncbi:hypothetical protein J6590_039350, partial [Homalodisca vitripennis]
HHCNRAAGEGPHSKAVHSAQQHRHQRCTSNGPKRRDKSGEGRGEANTVIELRERVRTLKQYSRRNNIDISGVPVTAQKDVISLVKDVGRLYL